MVSLVWSVLGIAAAASAVTIEIFNATSACTDIRSFGHSVGDLAYLGALPSAASCAERGADWSNGTKYCHSTCWFRATNLACYCRTSQMWLPTTAPAVDSALLLRPCAGEGDCSYNGRCVAGVCACDSAWMGPRCGELALLPVDKASIGYRETQRGHNVSTWGASILWDEHSGQWHGWASEMRHGCGINTWKTNSQIVHIVGSAPEGPFTREDVFAPAFAHEPTATRGPEGEWVLLYAGYEYNATGLAACTCSNCSNGVSPPPGSPGCPFQRSSPSGCNHRMRQMMAIAASPNGPWTVSEIEALSAGWDWNTAMVIHPDRSAVAMIRGGMVWHAANYSDNTTWRPVGGLPEGPSWPIGVEDPYLWVDARGVLHAICHGFLPFYSVHGFVDPRDTPGANWSQPMRWSLTSAPYSNVVRFTDNTSFGFSRRERPHLLWAPGGRIGGQLLGLSNGVEYGTAPNTPYQDGVFSLVQMVRRTNGLTL